MELVRIQLLKLFIWPNTAGTIISRTESARYVAHVAEQETQSLVNRPQEN